MGRALVNKLNEMIKSISELMPDDIAAQFVELGRNGLSTLNEEIESADEAGQCES